MGTLNEKLAYLNQTKMLIKEAIEQTGQIVLPSDTFRSYVDKIEAIDEITEDRIAEELMLINDGEVILTLTVYPLSAVPVITSLSNSIVIAPTSSSGGIYTYSISADSLKAYTYHVSAVGYVTASGNFLGGTSSLSITLDEESGS